MTDERLDHLIDQHLNGTMSDETRAELEERLLHSATDRARFWTLAESHALLHEGLQQQQRAEPLAVAAPPRAKARSLWLQWRPLTAAAAGIMLGMFCTSVVFAYVAPSMGKALLLLSEGFESGVAATLQGLPREAGVWSGDEARVVASDAGLKPKSGAKMLRFVSATFDGENAKRSAWSDVYRLVDLRGQVSGGKAVVRLSGSFDAKPFPAGEEYSCFVELCALEEDMAGAPQPLTLPWVRENSASVGARKIPMNGDGAWQTATVEVPVSSQTRCVLAHLAVLRRKPAPPVDPVQFAGHYLDDVKIELISSPSGH